jgi:translation initiation factor IF-3
MGREMAHQELGMEVMKKCIAFVNDLALIESSPKMEGKNMFLMLGPDPLKIKEYQKLHPNKSKQDTKELAELEEVEEDEE